MIEVRVPATSANIGPGFDCLGLALNMYNSFKAEEIEHGLEISGCDEEFKNEDNLFYKSMVKTFEIIGYKAKGLKIEIGGDIPVSRGLGSSASCIVGGVIAANEISKAGLNTYDIVNICAKIEGHPDNTTPAVTGGMTASIMKSGDVVFDKINICEGLKFCAVIPDFKLSTERARQVLPKTISYNDGVYNLSRTALLISSLINGNFDLIKHGIDDRMHQIYRGSLIENYEDVIKKCYDFGAEGAFLSGAGPTIMAVLREENQNFSNCMKEFLKSINKKWDVKELKIDTKGAMVIRN
ncbi:homoserine kinase [Caloramator quimbayensis]|uniref:Homoserine kinase n=1 Tax=Caloramator quimbayensis TaxID=1147123 RepID=A0A1T4XIH0_9CLOT|nr:homoserine kinase [Caloramator quimbayensis]SKA88918.1 homoserine kinase [Caloramator quimbayensis]